MVLSMRNEILFVKRNAGDNITTRKNGCTSKSPNATFQEGVHTPDLQKNPTPQTARFNQLSPKTQKCPMDCFPEFEASKQNLAGYGWGDTLGAGVAMG